MLSSTEGLQKYYAFIANHPHLSLRDICQIITYRENLNYCLSFEEWNAVDRRIIAGRKGIPYYDENGNKRFVFDVKDTYGKDKIQIPYHSFDPLIYGLCELNHHVLDNNDTSDYQILYQEVKSYFPDENQYQVEGISYYLLCKTGRNKLNDIRVEGLPFTLKENALIVKDVCQKGDNILNMINQLYIQKTNKTLEDEKVEVEVNQPSNKTSIQNRKRKEKTLLDLLDEKESSKEVFIKSQLLRGSMIEGGKKRIYEKYLTNPTITEFAKFLKEEYGVGGSHSTDIDFWNDAKGIRMTDLKNSPNEEIILNWKEVALRVADLIDDKEYYTPPTKEERIEQIVQRLIKEGTENSNNGSWIVYFEELNEDEEFVTEHAEEIEKRLWEREEIADVVVEADSFDMMFWTSYLENYGQNDDEIIIGEENTNLNDLEIQPSEFGGLKERYRNNVSAILTMQRINALDFKVTNEDKVTLAKYVGWGGIPQVFDEQDKNWKHEYEELKKILSQDDYEQAKASVLNAHYTSKTIIEGMYQALSRLGVKGNNRILEPAMGIGNFFGYMPEEIKENAKLYGIELDNVTGKIAKLLYPDVNIQIKGFEETSFPNDYFDIVITNVPFGAYSVHDPMYNQHHFYIHDYFIAKSLDKVRSGGIVAVITSKGTMDKTNPSVRKYIADRAELLGAIRLPNNAFEQTAKTKVTTDILFFQKRKEQIHSSIENTSWLQVKKTEEGYEINNYFIEHPEMLLGTIAEERGLYGAIDVILKPDGRKLDEALFEAIQTLPQNKYSNSVENKELEERKEKIETDYSLKPFCYKIIDKKLYMRIGEEMVKQTIPKKPHDAMDRIAKMIELRNQLHHILDLQLNCCSDEQLHNAQLILDYNYEQFVEKYGYINSSTNFKLFKEDGDSPLLFACETLSEDKKTATKADIFTKRTIRPYHVISQTNDCFEALQICKNERGKVDISYIEQLTKKDYNTILSELGNAIFRNPSLIDFENPYSGFETEEEYLSGNVVKKLQIAKTFAHEFPNHHFEKNIKALEEVQPLPLKASDISVRLGASWIELRYYKQFLTELLNMPSWLSRGIEITYNPHDNSYHIEKEGYVKWNTSRIYNTSRATVFRLYEDCLNLKATTIYDMVEDDEGKEKRILNQEETIAAREKQNKIKEEFKNWVFEDINRREELEHTYNQLFNQIRVPIYDGSYLDFPKMNPTIELKPHQKNAVHRIIASGNTLLHHVVGSGKTYTMCATIMKLRQYGLATKPMIVVPNHLVGQWANEFRTLYPDAKLLIANKEDLERHNRQRFVSKVAMSDWDAVIIAQSSFAKIPISLDRQVKKIKEEIAKVEMTILNQKEKSSRGSIKNLERIKKSKETKLKKLLDENKKDNVLIFENLGVDYLFVDEADCYKNLFLYTKMNNVSGISTTASQRASDLQLKCEYINELHGKDSGVVFATGTPISNSMTEMYTMQTYLQKRTLEELGITYFDGWAADFGETITSLEMTPSGQGYRAKTRFAKFTNLPELLTLYRSFADVQTSEMVKLNVPQVEKEIITLKPSDTILSLADEITKRAEAISEGNVDPHIDNMLKITSDGKKIALDPRCYDSILQDEESNKIHACMEKVFEIWEKTAEKKGTQLIFCDLSTPKKDFDEYEHGKDFDVYNELKVKLVQKGIPKEEIAYIHEAKSDVQKQALFQKVNDGKVRILIGSTEKCGAGTNVQKYLIALHHLDTPYRPRDLQQREGRIIRQGNINEKVQIYTYVTERTFDSYSYQILENKQRFISQIDRGDVTVREADDIDETTLSYAEIKAITAANPKIKRKMEVDTEVSRLRILEGQHKKRIYQLQDKIKHDLPMQIQRQTQYIEWLKSDSMQLQEKQQQSQFNINVQGINYTEKKDGAVALMEAIYQANPDEVIAEYKGFKIRVDQEVHTQLERTITLSNAGNYKMYIGQSGSGNLTRLDNFMEDFLNREERAVKRLEQLLKELEEAKSEVEKKFEYKEKLEELIQEQIRINTELNLNKKEDVIIENSEEENELKYRGILEEEEEETIEEKNFLIPDESITVKEMKDYGYKFEGMLPLNNKTAKQLFKKGCNIFLLYQDNTESMVEKEEDIEKHEGIYGIEIPIWNTYLEEEETKNYYSARFIISEAANKVVNEEMSYIDERFTYRFSEENVKEYSKLSQYFKDIPVVKDPKILKPYIDELLDEFTERLSGSHLSHYGWDEGSVTYNITKKIEDEAIRDMTHSLLVKKKIFDPELASFYHQKVKQINGTAFDLDKSKIQELYPILEEAFQGSKWDSSEQEKYSSWFLTFAQQTFPFYLNIQEDEVEKVIAYLNEQHLFAKEIVQKRVKDEFLKYKEKELLKTSEDIFNNSYQNYFYKEISDFLISEDNGLDEIHYEAFFEDKESVLSFLYDYYLKNEYASMNNYDDINDFIFAYNERYHNDILNSSQNEEEENHLSENKKETKEYIRITLPYEARIKTYDNHSFFKMPETSVYQGYTYNIANQLIQDSRRIEDLMSDSWELCLSIHLDKNSIVRLNQKGKDTVELSAIEFASIVSETKKNEYTTQKELNWLYTYLPQEAIIARYEESTLFQLPKGKYENYAYYIPNTLIKEEKETQRLQLIIPKDFVFHLKNYQKNESLEMKADEMLEVLKNKTVEEYETEIQKPSSYNSFKKREEQLIQFIPDEMKQRPNWCILRIRKNEEKGRLEKFIIDCHTGKFAKSDDPNTWVDFETACEYAKKNGGVSLVYALDGKDDIACIDLDHCIDEKGEYSPLAKEVIALSNGTYCEKSISETGFHLFGKTKGMDLRSFSKDGDLEFYQNSHFIAMTGNIIDDYKLESFDTPEMRSLLERKCDKRTIHKGIRQGIEGLSTLNDKEVVEKAIASKHGDTFKALYEGQDLRNNHSNSDMSLMNRLAFWCNGDKEQMLRIFATSGLYRENKSPEYYEYSAMKAIQDTIERFDIKKNPIKEQEKPQWDFGKAKS